MKKHEQEDRWSIGGEKMDSNAIADTVRSLRRLLSNWGYSQSDIMQMDNDSLMDAANNTPGLLRKFMQKDFKKFKDDLLED